jgi:hypothetical protein
LTNDFYEYYDPKATEKLKQSNLDRLEALANQGIALSVGDLAFIKMEALIDVLLPEDHSRRAKFDYVIEMKKKEIIDQVMAEIRKAQLMQGVPANSASARLLRP